MREWLAEQFESSAVIQGAMALSCVGAIIYLAVVGREIPEVLVGIVMAVVGFYFGTKRSLSSG